MSLPIPFLIPMEGGESSGGYTPPSLDDFKFDALFPGWPDWINKPLIQAVIAAIIVIAIWVISSRKLKVVPSKGQFLQEYVYSFVRNGIALEVLGKHDFKRYLPYLLGLFSFILVNNLFGSIPLVQLPIGGCQDDISVATSFEGRRLCCQAHVGKHLFGSPRDPFGPCEKCGVSQVRHHDAVGVQDARYIGKELDGNEVTRNLGAVEGIKDDDVGEILPHGRDPRPSIYWAHLDSRTCW